MVGGSTQTATGSGLAKKTLPTWSGLRKRSVKGSHAEWCENVDRIRFVHDSNGKCYLLLETEIDKGRNNTEMIGGQYCEEIQDSPPSYRDAAGNITTDATFVKEQQEKGAPGRAHGKESLVLAPGMMNPFLGFRRVERGGNSGIFQNLGVIDLPFNLDIAKKSLTSTISALYAMMLIVTCLVFVSTEVITNQVPLDYFESKGFYTFLYLVSICFMCYIFFYVLRVKVKGKTADPEDNQIEDFIKKMSEATGIEVTKVESETGDVRRLALPPTKRGDHGHPHHLPHHAHHRPTGKDGRKASVAGEHREEMLVKLMTSENEKSHGSMMLRLGAIAFGLGTLIYTGLEFVHFFEVPTVCESWHILSAINPALHMIFTFMQMYYLFMHARLNIQKNKIIAKFGLMHLLATNCCIWIRTLVRESMREIVESEEFAKSVTNDTKHRFRIHAISLYNATEDSDDPCAKVDILGNTIESSSIYLFPFIIEYSMIGAHIIYNMWKNVGRQPVFIMIGESETKKEKHCRRMDWSASAIGLFIGLFALVTLTITLILYFALVNQEDFHLIAVLIINVSDTIINLLMAAAIIIGFIQVRNLRFVQAENEHDILLIISAFGIFLYAGYTIIAGSVSEKSLEPSSLVIINGVVELIQVNLQLLFIADLKQKKVEEDTAVSKPGRQIVTFLILCNLGLWITYNFEIQKVNATPDQLEFYGFFPWVIIQRITLPLCVFFRFHSTVVFAELWKNCYIYRKEDGLN